MAGFKAEEVRAELEYDLGNGVKGRLVAPTYPELRKFRERVLGVGDDIEGWNEPIEGADGITDHMTILSYRTARLDRERQDEVMDQIRDAVIDVCNGKPTRDEVLALEATVQQRFVNWVLGEFSPLF